MPKKKIKKQEDKTLKTILTFVLYFIFVIYFSSLKLSILNFLSFLVFLVVMLLLYKNDLKNSWKEIKTKKGSKFKIFIFFIITFLISTILSNVVISILSNAAGIEFVADSSNLSIADLFKQAPLGTLFASFLTIIYFPIVEELVFRKSLGDTIHSNVLFILISSILCWYFQVSILNPEVPEFVLAIGSLFCGIFASIVYSKTKNIWYTIIPRMLYNIVICGIQLVFIFFK